MPYFAPVTPTLAQVSSLANESSSCEETKGHLPPQVEACEVRFLMSVVTLDGPGPSYLAGQVATIGVDLDIAPTSTVTVNYATSGGNPGHRLHRREWQFHVHTHQLEFTIVHCADHQS